MWSGSCLASAWRVALVGGPVGGGGGAVVAGQVQAQVRGGAQAAPGGDDLDGQAGGFQQPPGFADPGGGQLVVALVMLIFVPQDLHCDPGLHFERGAPTMVL